MMREREERGEDAVLRVEGLDPVKCRDRVIGDFDRMLLLLRQEERWRM